MERFLLFETFCSRALKKSMMKIIAEPFSTAILNLSGIKVRKHLIKAYIVIVSKFFSFFFFIALNPAQLPLSVVFASKTASETSSALKRSRRGYRAYYYNYLDEIAMSICAALPSEGPGLIYAVRRTCGEKPTCKDICTDHQLRKQGRVTDICFCTNI